MRVTVQRVYDWLDGLAPFDTAEGYDNAGLLVGEGSAQVDRVLFCVDVTEKVVREAVRQGAELIVSHHPLMFGGTRRIEYGMPEGRTLQAMLAHRLHLIAAHTNLDKAPGGTGDSLAQALGLHEVQPQGEYVRLGRLPKPLTLPELEAHVRRCLQAPLRRYGETAQPISLVAVGPGAAGEGVLEAHRAGAQAYVVGEIKHHELLWATAQGLVVLEAGHYATEAAGMKALYEGFQTMAAEQDWSATPLWFSQAPFSGALCR
jgi:dinuclear metal center YbgI/SA1388 family protein